MYYTTSSSTSRLYYDFIYNQRKNLPPRNSNQFDFFGFYTKTDTAIFSNTNQPLDNNYSREPLFKDYTSANMLETLINEFGEETKIIFELKTISGYNIYSNFQYANG